MTTKRRSLSKVEKLAAALLQIKRGSEWLIPEPLRSSGTAEEIASYPIEWDHRIPLASGGTNDVRNMQPLSPEAHKAKTRRDIANIARARRLTKKQSECRRKLVAKEHGEPTRERNGKRKSQMEYTRLKHRFKRRFDGSIVPRWPAERSGEEDEVYGAKGGGECSET
ncbi:hypothetical protein APY04_0768 [Hyphomicrobium sulfonivorans]|uniref:HNH domain-containing protein n=1 Tax=Hyphomicrobium sulfonivorans TaxID=121290 RepID=A0A120CXC5_HYPSL|nr:HNH endonuclease signature motif containing protein [Hyphomicrobium sulfonivorans]KWT70707.1 hypothetical protein APY04_0768 [Hyphomicrobium sulfonivorans]